jgi:hypothetical protein
MKIMKALKLDKYDDCARYTQYEGLIYMDATGGVGGKMGITSEPVYCVTLYAELEDDEEDTQYPLEDLLEKYCVNCTEVTEEKEEAGKRIFIFEVEDEDVDSIKAIVGLVGKRVYNYEEDNYVMLGIE